MERGGQATWTGCREVAVSERAARESRKKSGGQGSPGSARASRALIGAPPIGIPNLETHMKKRKVRHREARWPAREGACAPRRFTSLPKYSRPVADEALLALVRQQRPKHIVIAVGGGIQDKLGQYLLEHLDYRPAVHCIGAAIGFLTGDQVRIPDWADKYYLGWFFRSVAQPKVFLPRFWSARRLPWLIFQWREKLPPLES